MPDSTSEILTYFRLPYEPSPKQLLFHTDRAPYRLYSGSVGCGKSFSVRNELYAQCLSIAGWTALLIRRTSKELEDNHVSKFRVEMPRELATYNEQSSVATFFNGSTLRFGHLQTKNDLGKYLGGEYGALALDELTMFDFSEFIFLTSRNRNVKGKPNMLAATTPGGQGHSWVKALWIDREAFNGWVGYDKTKFSVVKATIRDNPHLMEANPDYIKTLENLPDSLRAAYLEGSWDLLAGQYFDCFDPWKHTAPNVEMSPWVERNVGVDWGYLHESAVLWGATDEHAERLTIYREFVQSRMTPVQLAEMIVEMTPRDEKINAVVLSWEAFNVTHGEGVTLADQIGEVLVRGGLPFPIPGPQGPGSRVPGWMKLYDLFRSEQIVLLHDCRRLIELIPQLQRNTDEGKIDDVQKTDSDNPADALRYLIQKLWGRSSPPFPVRVERELAAMQREVRPKDANHAAMMAAIARDRVRREGGDMRPFDLAGGRFRGGQRVRPRTWRFGR